MDVSIIIVNYHSARMVIDCIHSIQERIQTMDYEVIVVDNASGDDSLHLLRNAFGDRIKLIAAPDNLGFGKANNLGAQQAKGKYLFLLNPDTLLINDAVGVLYRFMEKNPCVGVGGGNLYTADMEPAPSFCSDFDDLSLERKRASWSNLIGTRIQAKLHIGKNKPLVGFNHTGNPKQVAYIFGADMMIPRSLFERIGGFDPDFFMYGEEVELTWRITQLGYKVMNIPQAKIIHLEGATTSDEHRFSERQFRMRMNGSLIYYWKRYGENGATEFFRLRTRRYDRLMKIARIQGKLTENFTPKIMKRLLADEYGSFMKKIAQEDNHGGSA